MKNYLIILSALIMVVGCGTAQQDTMSPSGIGASGSPGLTPQDVICPAQCPAGPAGEPGVQGEPGPAVNGVDGVDGSSCSVARTTLGARVTCTDGSEANLVDGARGADGAPGATGSDGAPGRDGADSTVPGPRGLTGLQGVAGPAGPPGAASTVPGPRGDVGPAGEPGQASTVPGPIGPAGPAGTITASKVYPKTVTVSCTYGGDARWCGTNVVNSVLCNPQSIVLSGGCSTGPIGNNSVTSSPVTGGLYGWNCGISNTSIGTYITTTVLCLDITP